MRLDVGKLGRGYLITLLLGMTILCLIALVVLMELFANYDDGETWWRTVGVVVVTTLVFGAALWGVIQRQPWSYYLSLAICVYWISMTAYSLTAMNPWHTNLAFPAAWWIYVTSIVLYGLALLWLVHPGSRAQFTPLTHKQ